MTTDSADALFETCLQDLAAGERMLAGHLPGIAGHAASADLREALESYAAACGGNAEALATYGRDLDGPDNLWMAGIRDDAVRDTQTTASGALLDTALIGAIRKATAAAAVSYDTAIAVARVIGEDAGPLERAQRRAIACDQALLALLPGTAALGKSAQTSS